VTARRDSLPSPSTISREIRDLVTHALALRGRYEAEYRVGLEAPGRDSVGVRVSGNGHGSPTETVAFSPFQRQKRSEVRRAAGAIRAALREVERAESILRGSQVKQPRKVDDRSFVSQGDFDRSLHLQRERELRGES
jgi:hypothetical protein